MIGTIPVGHDLGGVVVLVDQELSFYWLSVAHPHHESLSACPEEASTVKFSPIEFHQAVFLGREEGESWTFEEIVLPTAHYDRTVVDQQHSIAVPKVSPYFSLVVAIAVADQLALLGLHHQLILFY